MMVVPAHYVEIDATRICVKLVPLPRLSTREKFRIRRVRRKLFKTLRDMLGKSINDETKAEVERRIRLTLGRKCPK